MGDTLLTIRDEEIIATAAAYGIEIPGNQQTEILAKIRKRMLKMHIGEAIAFTWKELQG